VVLALACATGAFVATQSGATPTYGLDQIRSILGSGNASS